MCDERTFTVTRQCIMADCSITVNSDELMGLDFDEVKELIIQTALENDMWDQIESEENDTYEVDEE